MVKNSKWTKETIISDKIEGLSTIKLDPFYDFRGEIWTVYDKEYTDYNFVADKITVSGYGVLRGFHGDSHTAKLITCLSGHIQLAVLDLREGSETYGNAETFLISDCAPEIVIVPAGCVNAHLCLSEKCVFYYKWSEQYKGPDEQVTISWDDPNIDTKWIIRDPVLSERDKKGISFEGVVL